MTTKLHCDICDAVVSNTISPHVNVPMRGKAKGTAIDFGIRLKSSSRDICGGCLREAMADCIFIQDVAQSAPEGT